MRRVMDRRGTTTTLLALALIAGLAAPAHAARRFDAPLLTQASQAQQFEDYPIGLAIGDLDRDGVMDVVSAGRAPECSLAATIHRGTGLGGFHPPQSIPVSKGAAFPVIADFDADGALDVACGGFLGQSVLFGDGSGTQWTRVDLPSIAYLSGLSAVLATGLAAADFDGDGLADLAAPHSDGRLQVYLARPGRSFVNAISAYDSLASNTCLSVVAADLDSDGRQDLVISQRYFPDLMVLLGRGDGTFSSRALFSESPGESRGLSVADATGDGILDVVAERRWSIALHPGLGDGTFATTRVLHMGSVGAMGVAVADANADGIADVVYTNDFDCGTWTLPGLGGGAFGSPLRSPMSRCPSPILVRDLDADGWPDLIALGRQDSFLLGGLFSALGDGSGRFGVARMTNVPLAYTYPVAVGDIDEDGHADLILQSSDFNLPRVEWLALSSRSGRAFVQSGARTHAISPNAVEDRQVEDVDGDGHLDLAIMSDGTRLTWFPGDGAGGLGPATEIPFGSPASQMLVMDVTGDGLADILTAAGSSVRVMAGLGGGAFASAVSTSVGAEVQRLIAGSHDPEGRPVIALILWDPLGSRARLAHGNGDAALTLASPSVVIPSDPPATIGDVDGDGRQDLVVLREGVLACGYDRSDLFADVFLQGADGSLSSPLLSPGVGVYYPSWPKLLDIDRNGTLDLVYGHGDGMFVALGDGAGHFALEEGFGGVWPYQALQPPAPADFDGDGRLDVALADLDAVTILWGRDPVPPSVALLGPAPLPALVPGASAHLTWSATDDVGVASIDLFVSRHGVRGPFQRIASGLPDTGAFDWPVAGPLSDSVAFKIVARDSAGNVAHATSPALLRIVDPLAADAAPLPARLALAVAPNPARGRCEVRLALPRAGRVTLALHDLQGRRVATLLDAACEPGERRLAWAPAAPLRAGLYFLRLDAIGERRVQRLVVAE